MIVTLLNESMGYVHSTLLRWSLQREGRLWFSSNIRLFSNTKNSEINSVNFRVAFLWQRSHLRSASTITLQTYAKVGAVLIIA
ncbi:hypothetical protein BofuT4_uP005200.1 [Botrytis cinerea T4]|uniref:Uncharacterized protein n=1 Tax=Botryotinia fuckeliana (strain T4) TaxID=999810 RepID=G2Y3X1_BOTF4|nr:hypothetical protein BofuT4_uP005200.1 [Botrytis cinerea T4]